MASREKQAVAKINLTKHHDLAAVEGDGGKKKMREEWGRRQGLRKGGELALGVEKASGVESGVEKRFRRDEHQLCLLRGAVCQSSVSHIADPEAVHTHERSARSFFCAHARTRKHTHTQSKDHTCSCSLLSRPRHYPSSSRSTAR